MIEREFYTRNMCIIKPMAIKTMFLNGHWAVRNNAAEPMLNDRHTHVKKTEPLFIGDCIIADAVQRDFSVIVELNIWSSLALSNDKQKTANVFSP